MKPISPFTAGRPRSKRKHTVALLAWLLLASSSLLSQQAASTATLSDGSVTLMAALGLSTVASGGNLPATYSVQGTLHDASGQQYATLSLISQGLTAMRQEVSGTHSQTTVINLGIGSKDDGLGTVKKVDSREAMKPFHLLPTVAVLQQLISGTQVTKISADQANGCFLFSLALPQPLDPKATPQTLSLCINLASHQVVYEEEPFSFTPTTAIHTLRRTFLQYPPVGTNPAFPAMIQISVDGQVSYSLQIMSFNEAPGITSNTFQVSKGGK